VGPYSLSDARSALRAWDPHKARQTSFGLQRLADFIIRHNSALLPAPETMRRLNHAIVEYQHGRLRNDATAVLIEWQPDQPGPMLTP